MAEAWTDLEIDLIVADYFAMLIEELTGRPFSKAEHNRALKGLLTDPPRSRGSIEFKHQNISAVLLGLGQPWINGYKPAANFQNALVDGVLRWLGSHPDWLAPKSGISPTLLRDPSTLWIGPPPALRNEPPPACRSHRRTADPRDRPFASGAAACRQGRDSCRPCGRS